jgi:hypothetical protein
MELKNFENTLSDGTKVVTLGMTEDWNDIVVKMLEADADSFGNYSLEDTDPDMIRSWIDNAIEDGDTEYAKELQEALTCDAEILTLDDGIGDFRQTLGEVIVYYN